MYRKTAARIAQVRPVGTGVPGTGICHRCGKRALLHALACCVTELQLSLVEGGIISSPKVAW